MAARRKVPIVTLAAVALAAAIFGNGFLMMAYPGGWWGSIGHGMMRGYGPGFGYGAIGRAPGALGPGWNASRTDLNLSKDVVKSYFKRSIA